MWLFSEQYSWIYFTVALSSSSDQNQFWYLNNGPAYAPDKSIFIATLDNQMSTNFALTLDKANFLGMI